MGSSLFHRYGFVGIQALDQLRPKLRDYFRDVIRARMTLVPLDAKKLAAWWPQRAAQAPQLAALIDFTSCYPPNLDTTFPVVARPLRKVDHHIKARPRDRCQ
jgi:hypothetical protein